MYGFHAEVANFMFKNYCEISTLKVTIPYRNRYPEHSYETVDFCLIYGIISMTSASLSIAMICLGVNHSRAILTSFLCPDSRILT